MGAPILPRMPLPAREHPASSCLPATERSLCPHVIAESLCGRNTDLGPKDPSRRLGKARRRAASLQLLRPRAGAPILLFKGGDQPRHGAIITPPRRPSESEPAGAGGGQGTQMLRGRPARTPTLPPWPWKPLPSQRKNRGPAGESGLGGLTPARQPGSPGHPRPQPRPASGSWTPDSGRPNKRQTPQRLPDTRVSRPGRGPRAAARSVFSLPGRASAQPDHGRPPARPRPRWALSSWGWLFQQPQQQRGPAAGLTGAGALQGLGPLRRPQGAASHTPAPRRLGGQASRGPRHGGRGPGKGLAAWSPAGSGPQTRQQGPGSGRSWGHATRSSSSPSPPARKRGRVHPEPQSRRPHSCERSRKGQSTQREHADELRPG